MDIKKLLIGGIVGGILYFLLGWLVYGNLLMGFMKDHPGAISGFERSVMDYKYLALGNLFSGFLIAYIFMKGNVNSLAGGLVTGAIVGFLMCAGYNCITYGLTNLVSRMGMAADIAAFTVISGIVGAAVGMAMGMGKKTA